MIKELELIGLHKNEAKVYEALIKFGPCRAGLLINKLDVHRNLVYQSLENLILKGYATKVIKKGVWTFQITDPHSLLSGIKQKETILSEVIKEIKTYQHKVAQQIVVYEGVDSYRNFWISSLERIPKDTIDYTIGVSSTQQWIDLMGPVYEKYLKLRIEKRIVWQTIHFKITEMERKMMKKYPELTKYKLWPRNMDCVGNFNVIHDTLILQATTDPPRIIEIRDPTLVIVFKNYFDMMWEKAEEVKS